MRGRKPIPPQSRKSDMLRVLVTSDVMQWIDKLATASYLTTSDLLRLIIGEFMYRYNKEGRDLVLTDATFDEVVKIVHERNRYAYMSKMQNGER